MVQTIERVSTIFDVMAQSSRGISLKELSAKAGLPKGTAHRLLTSLAYFGYVRQASESKNYYLGFKLVELGNRLLDHLDLRAQARPFLISLCKRTKETVHLVILDQNEALYVDKVVSDEIPGGLQMVSRIGSRVPAHCSSVGKVFLAQFSEQELERLIKEKGLKKRTENTITNPEKLKHHLEVIYRQGYAVDDEENEKGIRCVGAPVFNQKRKVIAAISISGPTVRITKKIIQETLKNEVIKTALNISREFGYQG
ncbi:MAG: IclR family transcriptional regulator [Desulfobacterales bacterium]|nr:MAG: IclR family transcriptional regulator [Desulfobacterales bacterium]